MKHLALVTVFLAGLTGAGCSGPTPPGDAGFFPPPPTWEPGSTTGTGGSPGTGGSFGTGTGGGTGAREDGGRRRGDEGPDAATLAPCPPGTMDEATCAAGSPTCALSMRDGGGRVEVCTCRQRRGQASWRCEEP